jgi:pyrophosphatase PpaX
MMRCYDDVIATLELLHTRGHRMGVVTSKMSDFMNRSLEFTGIDRFFDVAVGMEASTRHKPDPEPVEVALRVLGFEPHEAVFVGDSPHDMHAGNAAGVTTIAALWGPFSREQLEESRPRYWLQRISDLPRTLERIAAAG